MMHHALQVAMVQCIMCVHSKFCCQRGCRHKLATKGDFNLDPTMMQPSNSQPLIMLCFSSFKFVNF